jgi:curved DNA-binding protein CbpA
MKTLYDLLGALPDDDAESIRAAFRKAAQANHPDRNPGDPEAPQRFRRIVRANAILRDERQRATYDQLLDIALRQQGLKPRRGIFFNKARRMASEAMTGAALGLFGGYLLLGPVPKVPLAPAHVVEVSAPEAAQTALVGPTELSDTVGRASPRGKPDDIAAPKQQENPETIEAATPSAAAPSEGANSAASSTASSTNTPPERDFGTNDARYYRERGISAYRSGDLFLALVDFDLAVSLDPAASDAYIDRGIVYHRLGDLKHAFADLSQAKRIDDSHQSKAQSKASPAAAGAP